MQETTDGQTHFDLSVLAGRPLVLSHGTLVLLDGGRRAGGRTEMV